MRLRRQAASGERPAVPPPLPPTAAPADPMIYYVLALVALLIGVGVGKIFL